MNGTDLNYFEFATKQKLRFASPKGYVSVEDLWDMHITDLDSIYKTLNKEVKEVQEDSLLTVKSKSDNILNIKIEIVKYIVENKLSEQKARSEAKQISEQKEKILSILETKEDEDLKSKTPEELIEMLKKLQ